MQIKILGTSNAWGPNPFYPEPPPWPSTGSLSDGTQIEFRKYRTSLTIRSHDGHTILVDCGPDLVHQVREFHLRDITCIALTHPHHDHVGGLGDLALFKPGGCLPISAYATAECWDCIRNQRGFEHVIEPRRLITANNLLQSSETHSFTVGSVTVRPFRVEHNEFAPGSIGYVFEETVNGSRSRVLYTGDLWSISEPDNSLFAEPFDVAIIECNRWEGTTGPQIGGGHMSFEESLRMLREGALSKPFPPRQVVYVHFGDYGPNQTASSYQDWRNGALQGLSDAGLNCAVKNPDHVIGYEGLTIVV